MSEVTQAHLVPACSLSKASGTALVSLSSSEPRLQVCLQSSGTLTSDQFVSTTAADRQAAKLLLSTLPQTPRIQETPKWICPTQSLYCICTIYRAVSTYSDEFKLSRWEDAVFACIMLKSTIPYAEATALLFHPNPLSSSPPTTRPPYHYLVGFCKEGSLLRKLVFRLQSLLIPPLFLSNTQQVSVLVIQALGKRERKDG